MDGESFGIERGDLEDHLKISQVDGDAVITFLDPDDETYGHELAVLEGISVEEFDQEMIAIA